MTTTTTTAAPTDQIEAVRAFNRFYTARIGALRDGLLATPYPLPEARVLFELGRRGTIDAADLRRVLDLDGGYLSRLLARLEAQDLVARERSPRTAAASGSSSRPRAARRTRRSTSARPPRSGRSSTSSTRATEPACSRRWARSARSSTARPVPGVRPASPAPRRLRLGRPSPRHALRRARVGHGVRGARRAGRGRLRLGQRPRPRGGLDRRGRRSSGRLDLLRAQRRRDRAAAPAARRAGHARDGRRLRPRRRVRRLRARGRLPARAPVDDSSLGAARRIYQRAGFRLVGEETSEKFGQDFTEQDWELVL